MPIKDLTNQRRLPRIDKIHLGIKTKNAQGVEFPQKVDYFVCDHPDFQKVYPGKPKELQIMIPVEDAEKWSSQYYRLYSNSRGLLCKGDGETCLRLIDTETGDMATAKSKDTVLSEMSCEGRDCANYGKVGCTEVMNLQFLLPNVPGLGVWQIDTGSINSIRNINSAADLIKGIYGRVSMIPLILTLEPLEIQAEGKKRTIYVLNLRSRETLINMSKSVKGLPMLAIETPVPDDEVPEMILPQNQEKVVTEVTQPETEQPVSEDGKDFDTALENLARAVWGDSWQPKLRSWAKEKYGYNSRKDIKVDKRPEILDTLAEMASMK